MGFLGFKRFNDFGLGTRERVLKLESQARSGAFDGLEADAWQDVAKACSLVVTVALEVLKYTKDPEICRGNEAAALWAAERAVKAMECAIASTKMWVRTFKSGQDRIELTRALIAAKQMADSVRDLQRGGQDR